MDAPVLYDQDGHVVVLTINRPDTRNAVTDADVSDALIECCARINADIGVRAAILTGMGSAFSSGGNIRRMRDREGIFAGGAQEIMDGYRRGVQRLARALFDVEVPLIAAVNGPAYGAGCDAAMVCDIRIAAEEAVFAENFVKVGLVSGFGGGWLLPRIAGYQRAAEMIFTGDAIDARTAEKWGLVSQVVAGGALMDAALALGRRIAVNPPGVLRMSKRLLRQGAVGSYADLLNTAAGFQAAAHTSNDHHEALESIFEKRPPRFTGH